tara:strand:+ start:603 stop:2414 length:1812 start_codon:yes stop_codon:yes gene_type:complete
MASSTIIELKEIHNSIKDQPELPNGFYKQILQNPVTLENGDSLGIHCGFIDTIASSQGKIDIDGTEVFTIGYTPFIQNTDNTGKVYNGRGPETHTVDNNFLYDNEAYFPCAGSHAGIELQNVVSMNFVRKNIGFGSWGNKQSLYFNYTNAAGVPTGTQITLPPKLDPADTSVDVAVNLVVKKDSFVYGGGADALRKFYRKAHVSSFSTQITTHTESGLNLEPLAFEYKFSLTAGSYEPKHICELITEELTSMQNVAPTAEGTDSDPINNAFLKTNTQIDSIAGTYSLEGKTIYVNTSGNGILQLPFTQHFPEADTDSTTIIPGFSGNKFRQFVGSDQVVLEFDEDLQKCVWSQLHSNIYSAGSGADGGGFNEDGTIIIKSFPQEYNTPASNAKFIYGSRHGCVGFNYLLPIDFWYDKLGLDPDICFSFEAEKKNGSLGTFTNVDTYKVKGGFIDGVNTTNSVINSSVAISKNQLYYQVPTRSSLEGTSTANVKCYGLNSLNAPTLEEGYFLISIDGFDNRNKLISKDDEKNTIKSIVSRFYTSNSYTSFYNEGNINQYVHYGEPITISSFTVKILNPEYEESNIQQDNTIFLELVKQPPQLQQ